MEHQVAWVSWIPQSLLRLRDLGTTAPIVFSHFNVFRLGIAGRLLLRAVRTQVIHRKPYVLLGPQMFDTPLEQMATGYQHAYCCRKLPPEIEQMIVQSKGGICVPKQSICDDLIDYCKHRSIQLWIFSVQTTADFLFYARQPGVDVIFSDNALATQHGLEELEEE